MQGRGGLRSPITHISFKAVNPFLLVLFCICDMALIIPIPQMRKKRPRECENRAQATQQ